MGDVVVSEPPLAADITHDERNVYVTVDVGCDQWVRVDATPTRLKIQCPRGRGEFLFPVRVNPETSFTKATLGNGILDVTIPREVSP